MCPGQTHSHAKAIDQRMHRTSFYRARRFDARQSHAVCSPCVTACLQTQISPLAFYWPSGQILAIKSLEDGSDLFNTCCPSTLRLHVRLPVEFFCHPFAPLLSSSTQVLYYFPDLEQPRVLFSFNFCIFTLSVAIFVLKGLHLPQQLHFLRME